MVESFWLGLTFWTREAPRLPWDEAKAAYVAVNQTVEAELKRVIIKCDAWNVIAPLKDKKSSSQCTIDVIL